MTPALRKIHRLVWIILPVLFPLLFWAAWSGTPKTIVQESLYTSPPEPIGQVLRTQDTSLFLLNLRLADSGAAQLEILLQQPLLHPSPVVYWLDQSEGTSTSKKLLGELGTTGVYRFPMPSALPLPEKIALEIYDTLQKETLLRIDL